MKLYNRVIPAAFIARPNRFIAQVETKNGAETAHVKNTGRCRELLIPGAQVWLAEAENAARKTRYDLVAVEKGQTLVNMDSQAPNKVVYEWLKKQDYDFVKPEYTYGNSRIDFYMEKGKQKYLMEVKGCTLEIDGAKRAGVKVLFLGCRVEEDSLTIDRMLWESNSDE